MFEMTPPTKMVQDMVRQWCQKELMPKVPALEAGEEMPYDLMRDLMKKFGLDMMARNTLKKRVEKLRKKEAGEDVGEDKGGLAEMAGGDDADPMMMMVLVKELSRVSPGFAMSWGVSMGLAGGAIISKGTADQVEKYGIPLATMEKVGSWCLTEPGAGSDAFGSMKTSAKPDGDYYVLNGGKTFITNGPCADTFVVYSKIDRGEPTAEQPVNTFILEKGMEGFTTGKPFKKMGMKDSPTCELFFDNVRVPKENLLGGKEKSAEGRKDTKESLGNERSGIPAMALGIIEECYERCVKYVKEREQFGRPIGDFQAVQLHIADMYIKLKNVENLVYRTAWMQKKGINDPSFVNASKAYASRMAGEVALTSIQLHGGYGYMEEYHVEKLARDARLLELGAGTTDINLLTAARNELGLLK